MIKKSEWFDVRCSLNRRYRIRRMFMGCDKGCTVNFPPAAMLGTRGSHLMLFTSRTWRRIICEYKFHYLKNARRSDERNGQKFPD